METREEEIGSGLGCRSVSQCGGDKWTRRTLPPAVGRLVLAVGPVQRRMTALMGHACHATATASYLLLPPSMRCKKEECVNMLLAVIGVCALFLLSGRDHISVRSTALLSVRDRNKTVRQKLKGFIHGMAQALFPVYQFSHSGTWLQLTPDMLVG
jgi:hypothetical protein